jgi:hypothetical protein
MNMEGRQGKKGKKTWARVMSGAVLALEDREGEDDK